MPTECSRDLYGYEVVEGRQVVAAFDGGQVTSDAGALLLGAADRALGLVRRLARCFTDGRAPELVEHTVETMLMQRICGIALGYEDLVDHDELRHDPVLAALAGKLEARRKDCAPLAGKSTLNRLEHAPRRRDDRYHKIGMIRSRSKACSSSSSSRRTRRRPRRSFSIWMRPTILCMAIRKVVSSMAITTVTATCRCTCSAVGTCSPPSPGARTSMRPPAPRMKWPASSARSGPAGRGSSSCFGRIRASPETS